MKKLFIGLVTLAAITSASAFAKEIELEGKCSFSGKAILAKLSVDDPKSWNTLYCSGKPDMISNISPTSFSLETVDATYIFLPNSPGLKVAYLENGKCEGKYSWLSKDGLVGTSIDQYGENVTSIINYKLQDGALEINSITIEAYREKCSFRPVINP